MNSNRKRCIDIDGKKTAWNVLKIIGMVILGIAACVLFGFVVMWLWNWLMPMLFGLIRINYWQAIGIFLLAKILFGGIGGSSKSDDSDDSKNKDGTIRGEISKEIKKEFDKEFEKEYQKHTCHEAKDMDNDDYDRMYDEWWEAQGEKSFERYMNNKDEAN